MTSPRYALGRFGIIVKILIFLKYLIHVPNISPVRFMVPSKGEFVACIEVFLIIEVPTLQDQRTICCLHCSLRLYYSKNPVTTQG